MPIHGAAVGPRVVRRAPGAATFPLLFEALRPAGAARRSGPNSWQRPNCGRGFRRSVRPGPLVFPGHSRLPVPPTGKIAQQFRTCINKHDNNIIRHENKGQDSAVARCLSINVSQTFRSGRCARQQHGLRNIVPDSRWNKNRIVSLAGPAGSVLRRKCLSIQRFESANRIGRMS